MSKVDELLESISGLTLVEAYELVKAIEEKFEVSAAAPVGVAVAVANWADKASGPPRSMRTSAPARGAPVRASRSPTSKAPARYP